MEFDIEAILAILGVILGLPFAGYFVFFRKRVHQARLLLDDIAKFADDYDNAVADGKLTDVEIAKLSADAVVIYGDIEVILGPQATRK